MTLKTSQTPARARTTLQSRKQRFVRDTIWDAAIDLFASKGFERTTVEDIAAAAGVSRRSFFRYFSSKNDLLAQGVVTYGAMLSEAVERCPKSLPILEVMIRATTEVANAVAAHPRAPQIASIRQHSSAARDALISSLPSAEDKVGQAFAARMRGRSKDPIKSRLLAAITLSILNVVITSWCTEDDDDIAAMVKSGFATLAQLAAE